MIDLTPLDVRKKSGDFTKSLRGYEPQQVDSFLQLTAERLEELVKENIALKDKLERLEEQVEVQTGRERAVNDALVTAQQLRQEIASAAEREADAARAEAKVDADKIRAEAEEAARKLLAESETRLSELKQAAKELTRRRARFLANFRQLLEREIDVVEMQEADTVEDYMVVGLGSEALSAGASVGTPPAEGEEEDAGADAATAALIAAAGDEFAALASEVAKAAEEDDAGEESTADEPDASATDPEVEDAAGTNGRSRWASFEFAGDDLAGAEADASASGDEPAGDASESPSPESAASDLADDR